MSEFALLFAPLDQSAAYIDWKAGFGYISKFAEWGEMQELVPEEVEIPTGWNEDSWFGEPPDIPTMKAQKVTAEVLEDARMAFAEKLLEQDDPDEERVERFMEGRDNPFSPVERWLDDIEDEYFIGDTTARATVSVLAVKDCTSDEEGLRDGWSSWTVTCELDEYTFVPWTWGVYDIQPLFLGGEVQVLTDDDGNRSLFEHERLY